MEKRKVESAAKKPRDEAKKPRDEAKDFLSRLPFPSSLSYITKPERQSNNTKYQLLFMHGEGCCQA